MHLRRMMPSTLPLKVPLIPRGAWRACAITSSSSSTSPKIKIVRTDSEGLYPSLDAGVRAMDNVELVLLPEDGTTEDQLVDACADATILLHCYTPVTERVIANAPKLRAVVKYGVGIDKVDIDACIAHGVAVCNVPEYGDETVAEGAFHLLLGLAKQCAPLRRRMDAAAWAWPTEAWLGRDLAGMAVGLVGFGKIGAKFARMAHGFRMRVLAYDPHVSQGAVDARAWTDDALAPGTITMVDGLDDLLAHSDAVSVHAVSNAETRGLLGARELALLRPSALAVNVSRGEIWDEGAVVDAVLNGRLAGVGADVFCSEPITADGHAFSPLVGHPRALLTPHFAFWTAEARDRLCAEALERCAEALEGKPLRVLSHDPRLLAQAGGRAAVEFGGWSSASGRHVPPAPAAAARLRR